MELTEPMRDAEWLGERTRLLWEHHFADTPTGYPIVTEFGLRARYRFGSIAARNGKTIIRVNQLFAHPALPVFVVDATLAHELAHYVHGFGSGLPRKYEHPHRGGVIEKELAQRGLGELEAKAEAWRKQHWEAFYGALCEDITERRSDRADQIERLWNAFLTHPQRRPETELQSHLRRLAPRFGYTEETPPLAVAWLQATSRQTGLSYYFPKENTVRLHGLCADRRVPISVLEFEIAYWLARRIVGGNWTRIEAALRIANLAEVAEEGLQWRRRSWTAFRNRHHPLG